MGFAPIVVSKCAFRAPDDIQVDKYVVPREGHGVAPNLTRVALASAPAEAVPGINQQLRVTRPWHQPAPTRATSS